MQFGALYYYETYLWTCAPNKILTWNGLADENYTDTL